MNKKRILGPNMKKLLARVMSRKAIPPGGGFVDGINFIKTPGVMAKAARESLVWIDQQINDIKAAPDNEYGHDEESIAGAILSAIYGKDKYV
ncbi:hypothetical protein KAR91_40520 [Candidatus Pacearchaeota archaeon]|nr:hypothetical protein [Candidatus Pacearchaeota archaeon]